MIHIGTGNICNTEAEALVCAVNCVGVMGKGVALAVKLAFPDVFVAYKAACDIAVLFPGGVLKIRRDQLGPRWVLCFATKAHWRTPSRLNWIETGLSKLVDIVEKNSIRSIAIPPLGCGNGGLDWKVVRPMIVTAFESLSVDVYLYEPEGST